MASRKKIADDEIWVSMIFNDHTITVGVEVDRNEPGWAARIRGEPVAPENLPLRAYLTRKGVDPRKFRPIISGGAGLLVSLEVVQVLQGFDLGGSLFVPVQIYQPDHQTKVEKSYFTWRVLGRKTTLIPAESRDIRLPEGRQPETTDHWKMPWHMKDDDIAVSRMALEGPDIWSDNMAYAALFMKGRVVAALREADLTRRFRPKKCRAI